MTSGEAVTSVESPRTAHQIERIKGGVGLMIISPRTTEAGNDVTILNPFDSVLGAPFLDRTLQRDHLQRRFRRAGVRVSSQRWLRSIDGSTLTVEDAVTKETSQIGKVDAVVLISGRRIAPAFDDLGNGADIEVHRIGDCARPYMIGSAIADGHRVGRLL